VRNKIGSSRESLIEAGRRKNLCTIGKVNRTYLEIANSLWSIIPKCCEKVYTGNSDIIFFSDINNKFLQKGS
jgi:hypothetical protein